MGEGLGSERAQPLGRSRMKVIVRELEGDECAEQPHKERPVCTIVGGELLYDCGHAGIPGALP
jgi:hypothetical protein